MTKAGVGKDVEYSSIFKAVELEIVVTGRTEKRLCLIESDSLLFKTVFESEGFVVDRVLST